MKKHTAIPVCFAALLAILYLWHIEADSIGGLFGVFWSDEGTYLLAAKNQALFGTAHFFPGDVWRPELTAPLLHYYALLTMTTEDTLFWVRTGIALLVLSGAWILARLADEKAPWLCFIAILLNPVLYFYARVGLSEGLQFFLLALVIACLHRLYHSAHYLPVMLCGALTAMLFWSKISSAGACCGIIAGLLAVLHYHRSQALSPLPLRERVRVPSASLPPLTPALPLKGRGGSLGLLLAYLLAALIVSGLFFLMLGHDSAAWWQRNIDFEVARRAPANGLLALHALSAKITEIGYYLALMPIIGLYMLALLIPPRHCEAKPKQSSPSARSGQADKLDCRASLAMTANFARILLIVTLTTYLIESFFGSDIRRNFFSLALLSILGGFTVRDYIAHGMTLRFKTLAIIPILLHAIGLGYVLEQSIPRHDAAYIVFSLLSLSVMLLACLVSRPRFRKLLLAVVALCSLSPMVYGSFFAPDTMRTAAAAMETRIGKDDYVIGAIAPWSWTAMKRRIIFTRCVDKNLITFGANDPKQLPLKPGYYLSIGDPARDSCRPDNADAEADHIALFDPVNKPAIAPGSAYWHYQADYFLFPLHR